MKLRVQTMDFGNSTTRGGKFIPAIVTRQTNRSIDLKPGQSFAITGLLNTNWSSNSPASPRWRRSDS